MSERVLVIAAHPDDETLGMGGTIAYHVNQGDSVAILFIGSGVGARDDADEEGEVAARIEAASRALNVLGGSIVGTHRFPDNMLDTIPLLHIVKVIESVKNKIQPTLVYTHHGGDLNIDHQVCFQATAVAFRPQPDEACTEFRTFEVNSATEWAPPPHYSSFHPNLYIDVSAYRDQIQEALDCYKGEMRDAPHSRSIDAVLTGLSYRGSQVGVFYAEAFMSIRRVIKT